MPDNKPLPPKTVYKIARLFHESPEGGLNFSPFEEPLGSGSGDHGTDSKPRIITDQQEAIKFADSLVEKHRTPYGVFACIDIRRPQIGVIGQLTQDVLTPGTAAAEHKPPRRSK